MGNPAGNTNTSRYGSDSRSILVGAVVMYVLDYCGDE